MGIRLSLLLSLLFLTGCAGLNFSQSYPGAEDFHPGTIVVLPATVGEHEAARDIVGVVLAKSLVATGWYTNVTAPDTVKARSNESPEFLEEITAYILKLNTTGVSDKKLAQKIGELFEADALILALVTSWGYGRVEGDKVARVGLGIKLVDAQKGTLVWKASHKQMEDYLFFKPDLGELGEELATEIIEEMPH